MQWLHNKTIASVLASVLIFTLAYTPLHKAEAQEVVFDPTNWIQNNLTALSTTISAKADTVTAAFASYDNFKEMVLDPLAWHLATVALQRISQSIITWANNGFNGSPAFMTDLQGFLFDIADETAGEFIYGSELGFLCSPFQLDVRIALMTQYQQERNYQAQCTLSGVTNNIEGVLRGDVFNWPSWFELTQDTRNTPQGAYFDAKAELDARIRTAQGREIEILNWGDGFLSFKACQEVTNAATGQQEAKCEMTTPGSIIQDTVGDSLTIGSKKLIVADEIDEVVSAVFAALAEKALTGAMGMLGLGGSSYGDRSYGSTGQMTYLEALGEDADAPRLSSGFEERLAVAVANYEDYIDKNFEIVERISAVLTELQQANTDPNLEPGCFRYDSLPTDLSNALADASAVIAEAERVRVQLDTIETTYFTALSIDDQQAAIDEFDELLSTGLIADELDILEIDLYIEQELTRDISDFRRQIAAERNRCQLRNSTNTNDPGM